MIILMCTIQYLRTWCIDLKVFHVTLQRLACSYHSSWHTEGIA